MIFGSNGQDGRLMSKLYDNVIGLSHKDCDVSDYNRISHVINDIKPDIIYNFAARSSTKHSVTFENHTTITTGTLNILEAIKTYSPKTKVFITGSGLQFRSENKPIHESNPFEANNSYSAARIYSTYLARYYRTIGIKTYVGYLFHHESQHRQPTSISKIILNAARRISEGHKEVLEIGDLDVFKEWTYAGDVVNGIKTLVEQDKITEAVIGSGDGYTIKDWAELCFSYYGLNYLDHITTKSSFKSEYSYLISDPRTMRSIGWRPMIDLRRLLEIMATSAS
jgi:GDPmannose 4,6-dehydratase